jgi:hypothetical protein
VCFGGAVEVRAGRGARRLLGNGDCVARASVCLLATDGENVTLQWLARGDVAKADKPRSTRCPRGCRCESAAGVRVEGRCTMSFPLTGTGAATAVWLAPRQPARLRPFDFHAEDLDSDPTPLQGHRRLAASCVLGRAVSPWAGLGPGQTRLLRAGRRLDGGVRGDSQAVVRVPMIGREEPTSVDVAFQDGTQDLLGCVEFPSASTSAAGSFVCSTSTAQAGFWSNSLDPTSSWWRRAVWQSKTRPVVESTHLLGENSATRSSARRLTSVSPGGGTR